MQTLLFGFGFNVKDDEFFAKSPAIVKEASADVESHARASDDNPSCELSWPTVLDVSWDLLVIAAGGGVRVRGPAELATSLRSALLRVTDLCTVSASWNHVAVTTTSHRAFIIHKDSKRIEEVRQYLDRNKKKLTTCPLTAVRTGDTHTVGLTVEGVPGLVNVEASPPLFTPFLLDVKVQQVSCGKEHLLFLTSIGTVYSMGIGSRGQLGNGSTESRATPQLVEALEPLRIVSISAGGWHSAAVSDIGDLYMWGWNESGQLGLPSESIQQEYADNTSDTCVNVMCAPYVLDLPVINNKDPTVTRVSCGARHTVIMTDEGDVLTCGWNKYGQLGHGDTSSRQVFTVVAPLTDPALRAISVTAGGWTTLVHTVQRRDASCVT